MQAFIRAEQARQSGARSRVFDWDKAAALLRERKPEEAIAGLRTDMEWTGGIIYRKGDPVMGDYTYLSSNWATPILVLDGEEVECWGYCDELPWDSGTKWPESALAILRATDV